MTGTTWMMLLSVLLVSVGLSYSGMKKMSAPLPKYTKSEVAAAPQRTIDSSSVIAVEPRKKEGVRNWDLLWKNSLFKDDRTEVEAAAGPTDEAGSQEQVNNEFELVGIARMGRKDASTPVAIILEVKNNARNRMNNMNNRNNPGFRRPGGFPGGDPRFNRPNDRPTLNTPPTQEPENRKANKSLYRIGDKVASTEYVVKNIIMEDNKVVLERGGVETVLILDEKNTNSSIRRERVKNEEMAVRAKYAQKTEAAAAPQTPQTGTPQQGVTPQNGTPGQGTPPNGFRPGMPQRPFMQGQRNMPAGPQAMQPVQQNPTSGMPPLPPTMPGQNNGGVQQNNNSGTTGRGAEMRRRYSPIPQRVVD